MSNALMAFNQIEQMLTSAKLVIHSEERKMQLMYNYMGIATDGSSKSVVSDFNSAGGFSTEVIDDETVVLLTAL